MIINGVHWCDQCWYHAGGWLVHHGGPVAPTVLWFPRSSARPSALCDTHVEFWEFQGRHDWRLRAVKILPYSELTSSESSG